ncbi:MAG: hypothetical protein WCF10_17865, partial [Polyangiales bacterium]
MRLSSRRMLGSLAAFGVGVSVCIGVGCSGPTSASHEPGTIRQAECVTCHEVDRKQALNPPHDDLPATCQDCHSEDQWVPALSSTIHTPLPASCVTCHQNEPRTQTLFHTQVIETECVSCHRSYPDWA